MDHETTLLQHVKKRKRVIRKRKDYLAEKIRKMMLQMTQTQQMVER